MVIRRGEKMAKKMRQSIGDYVFTFANNLYLFVAMTIVLYPLIYVVSASFSTPAAVISGKVWLFPVEPTVRAYQAIFSNSQIVTGYRNSIIYTVLGTTVSVILTVLAAYPLSRKDFYGRGVFTVIFVFTMLFSGGLIPTYLLIKNLGMYNTTWAMILPNAMGIWNVVITRTYFQTTIPDDLYEAAELDGCSDFKFLYIMVIPLSGPIIAVMVLYYAIGIWNSYFDALIYLSNFKYYPLQIILRNILIINQIEPSMISQMDAREVSMRQGLINVLKYAVIVAASVPMLIVYPFVQKYFIRGIMIGSLKG